MSDEIVRLRAEIDETDKQLRELLSIRMRLSKEMAKAKAQGTPVRSEAREREILTLARESGEEIERIYRRILFESRKAQYKYLNIDKGGIIDISKSIMSTPSSYAAPEPRLEVMKEFERDGYNYTNIFMCAHSATHIDAPLHFIDRGADVSELEPERYFGECLVVSAQGEKVGAELIDSLPQCERLLIKGSAELDEAAARAIVRKGIKLVGTELTHVGLEKTPKAVHLILLEENIAIIENICLDKVETGEYFLCALPLKIEGCEGSPCRAVLIEY